MFKVMGLIQRRSDLPLDAFRLHWRTTHRGLALRLAEAGLLAGYVQNHRLDISVEGLKPVADGVPELWFTSADVFAAMRDHPTFREGAYQDEPDFMDVDDYRSQPLTEECVHGLARQDCVGLLKTILFLGTGEPCMPVDQSVRHAVQSRHSATLAFKLAPYASVQTIWWPDLSSFRLSWKAYGRVASGLLAEERPVFWPGERPPPADWRPRLQTRA
ncbi:EthD domain-containing protein [Novosphingobium sp. ERN07]|uniref:EthD domain-containing protein n=1 Tax=Novosphingobium sp. ERN07 TaxID=2726187 RepID=UPI0014577FA8|nr:EthD domain-containing protein [Novosphingobium sp. ERN07]NLR73188.1 EthD domain-containing protein [Novosphingobium sp. ERN07]